MPRNTREIMDGGIYHVFNRGNDQMALFHQPEDFKFFYRRFLALKNELRIKVYHYCLMTNHFHFLLKVDLGSTLRTLMHRSQLMYALYFKKKHAFVGHVFQERYRSPRISEESHYLQCGRYIERNPVKAKMVEKAIAYNYSSACFYGVGKADVMVTPDPYYIELGKTDKERQTCYRQLLQMDEPYSNLIETSLLKS